MVLLLPLVNGGELDSRSGTGGILGLLRKLSGLFLLIIAIGTNLPLSNRMAGLPSLLTNSKFPLGSSVESRTVEPALDERRDGLFSMTGGLVETVWPMPKVPLGFLAKLGALLPTKAGVGAAKATSARRAGARARRTNRRVIFFFNEIFRF